MLRLKAWLALVGFGQTTRPSQYERAGRAGADRQAREPIPQLYCSHDHYAMLYRLATRKDARLKPRSKSPTNSFLAR